MAKPGRNDPCPCGSGKKYKKCCERKFSPIPAAHDPAAAAAPTLAERTQLVALLDAGRHLELEDRTRILVERYPNSAFAWLLLGASHRGLGKDALPAFQKAAELAPDDPEIHSNLGVVLKERGHLDRAVASYRRALQINTDYAEAHYNLGNALRALGQFEEAAASYRRTLEIRPRFAEAHFNLGLAVRELGQINAAAESIRRALEINPDNAEAHLSLGTILLDRGRQEEAKASYRRALEINPDYMEARLSLAQAGKVNADDQNFRALVALEESARAGDRRLAEGAVFLHFALGKCYDDIGDYERAFPHFLEACRLKRATLSYDPHQTTQRVESIIRCFDKASIDKLRGGGDPSHLPIFILGMPRSGTTLVEQIIASHPDVHGAGELPDLMQVALRPVAVTRYPEYLQFLDKAQLAARGAEYVTRLQPHAPGTRRITDKMPQNFLAIGLIHLMLPNAKIIHVGRNAVDTCLSCFTQPFIGEQNHTYDLTELGQYYRDYFRLMRHWRATLQDGAFLDVRYEDVVADQEAQARRIIEHCGLKWNDACLDFHRTERVVQTASMLQVRQPIYGSSVERWRNYERFLGPLLDALGDLAIAGS